MTFESALPDSVLQLVEMTGTEDLILALLRDALPDIACQTLIARGQTFPFILVRRNGDYGEWDGDPRFLDAAQIDIHVYVAEGVNTHSDAQLLSEAVRVTLRDSINKVVPGYGYLVKCDMKNSPRYSPDWAPSVGPVQYADLPEGVIRYQSLYDAVARKPATRPFA